MTRRISPSDFGPLYHGTSLPGLEVIDQRIGGHRYSSMRGTLGFQFATTSFDEAVQYARTAGYHDERKLGGRVETVYEVQPLRATYGDAEGKRYRYHWGVDENSGPNGWNDNHDSLAESLERARGGGAVSLKFESPLRAREIWSRTNNTHDLTMLNGAVPYRFLDGRVANARDVLGKPTGRPAPWDLSVSFT